LDEVLVQVMRMCHEAEEDGATQHIDCCFDFKRAAEFFFFDAFFDAVLKRVYEGGKEIACENITRFIARLGFAEKLCDCVAIV